ncbi:hybrid sensor histidine kinase/response regulator [Actinoplanes sp. CA-015351]|uniref:hybrid sensor histidine kinase/response regulator n=1 Tax=Actinoplanes sp. CA-015351 TaxID=3239897 RepID=UPI003D967C01
MGRDPLRYFRLEARELIDQISAGVLDLDQRPGPEPVGRLLRAAHTLKGAARVVKQKEIADFAHAFEEILVPYRSGDAPLASEEMRELLRLNDEISAQVVQMEAPAPEPATVVERPIETIEPAEIPAPTRASTSDLDELLDAIGEANAQMAPLRDGCGTIERLHRAAEALADQLRTGTTGAVRAAAVRLAGELGTAGRRFTDAVDQIERELDDVRGKAEGLRLVPAGSIFTTLRRAVRDAADAEGRKVRFESRGGDIRMGVHLLGPVSGAFLHVVRNAVVHGIEPEAQRLEAGKPAEGTITLEVERRGRFAIFRCVDDGRGFDLDGLRRTARERGLLGPGTAGDQELVDLVMHGGISTTTKVTEVSGRGIGMDAVREVAAQLHGEVRVRSTPGQGATVELIIPLTLLSMTGLIVEAGGASATVPLDAVRGCLRLSAAEAATAASSGRILYDGSAAPFLPLAEVLYTGDTVPDAAGTGAAIVVDCSAGMFAIGVDRLLGTSALVARPLPELAPASAVISSVSVEADGRPRLVLDPEGLAAAVLRGHGPGARSASASAAEPLPVLVVDDSLTTRMLERSILESAGYEVQLAASGEEGLEKARSGGFGLILSDIDMPGIDGFTLVERIRADPKLSTTPCVLVSSRASAADRDRGKAVGADAYVVKGEFDQEELLAHIRRLVVRS